MARRTNPLIALGAHLILKRLGLTTGEQERVLVDTQEVELGNTDSVKMLKVKDGSVTVIIGRRESGKTVVGYRLAQLLGRPMYTVSPEQTPPKSISELALEDIEDEPPPHSTLFLDDLPAYMGARDYNNPLVRVIEKLVPVVRHRRKIHLIFSTQLASLSDKYALDADCVILKPPSILYEDLERASVRRKQDEIAHIWEGKSENWIHQHAFLMSHMEKVLVRVNKPTFM